MTISGAVLSLKNPSRFESLRCDSPCVSHIFASRVSDSLIRSHLPKDERGQIESLASEDGRNFYFGHM